MKRTTREKTMQEAHERIERSEPILEMPEVKEPHGPKPPKSDKFSMAQ